VSIKKHVDGRGRIRFRVYVYDANSHRTIYVATLDRVKDAQESEHEAKRRLRLGEPLKPKPSREEITFDELGKRWLSSRQNIRQTTRVDYEQSLRRLKPYFGKKVVSEITRKNVDAAVADLSAGFAPSTCRKAMTIFAMVMKTGVAWGHLDSLPVFGQRLALPRVRRNHFEPLTPEQVNHLVDAAPEYWKAAVLVLFTVAPRRAELFGIRLRDVDLTAGTITIRYQLQKGRLVEPKSESAIRKVVLPSLVVEALRCHIDRVPPSHLGLLFPSETGLPVDADNWFKRVWVPTRAGAGLPHLRVHDARHHVATILLSQGHSVKVVQRMLGHATAAILLDVYASVTKQGEDEAAVYLDRWLGKEECAVYAANRGNRVTGGAAGSGCRSLAA
jgi:integrase